MPDTYNPYDWFWIVGGDESRYWSSATAAYVDVLPDGAGVTRIGSESELSAVLAVYGLRGPIVSVDDVAAERERRLALGFDYDFGDERGVHRIATTDADMRGWDEVTKWAHAAIALGDPDATMHILTETGPCVVTAQEWQSVLMAATAARQPLWAASFVLQAMDPIPSDYTNDAYWQNHQMPDEN